MTRLGLYDAVLWRNRPAGLCLAIDADVLLRHSFRLVPIPGGERVTGNLRHPVTQRAIVAVHVSDNDTLTKWYRPLRQIHDLPIIGHDDTSRHILSLWHLLKAKKPEIEPRSVTPDSRRLLRRFYAMTEIEQTQLLKGLHLLSSWLDGWQMEEAGHQYFNRLFALLHKAVLPRTASRLTTIYRYAYLATDLSAAGGRRIITSPYRFQSWTTTADLAVTIGQRNVMAASSPTRRYLTVFQAAASDVDIVVAMADVWLFIAALIRSPGWQHHEFSNKLWQNIYDLHAKLDQARWQNEVVVHSPVNRRLIARVVSVQS